MDAFHGREEELRLMNRRYDGPALRTCAITGRRRIGKSRLIEEFCRDKPHIIAMFEESGERRNLRILGDAVSAHTGLPEEFDDLDRAFGRLTEICRRERVVVALDEYPYLAGSSEGVSSRLKGFIDDAIEHSGSMLIVCGSSISAMEEELDDEKKPLHGRFTLRIRLGPLGYGECAGFHPGMSDEGRLMLYMTLGGCPMYHSLADADSYRECVSSLFLGRLPELDDELSAIVSRGFRPAWKYTSVLEALGDRQATLADIARSTGFEPPVCLTYLKKLMAADIVETVTPMMDAPRGPTYRIADDLVAFESSVMLNRVRGMHDTARAYEEIYPEIRSFLGMRFERFCEGFLREHYACRSIGRWWGRIGGEDTDIDIVADISEDGILYNVFVECKFTSKAMGFGALDDLTDRLGDRIRGRNARIMLISLNGFEEKLRDYAEEHDVVLLDLDVLVGRRPVPSLRKPAPPG